MAWQHQTQAVETGVVTDPRDFILNVDAYAREMNGFLDRDNFAAAAVTSAKIGVQELVAAGQNPYGDYGGAIVQAISGGAGQWTEVSAAQTTITVDDGEMIVDADIVIKSTLLGATYGEKWRTRLTIDGVDVAFTDWVSLTRTMTGVSLTGSAPVTTGTSVVQVFVQHYVDPNRLLTDLANGTNGTATFAQNPTTTGGTLDVITGNVVWVNRKR